MQQSAQNDMHCLYKEVSHPTSIQHSLRASFLSPFAQNLIVIKAGRIEIYNIDIEAGKSITTQQFHSSPHNSKTTTPLIEYPTLPSSTTLHQNLLANTVTAPILSLHTSAQLYGNVIVLKSIHLPNQTTESLVLLFDNNNISVVHWDPVSLCICTVFVYNAELRDMAVPHGVSGTLSKKTAISSIQNDNQEQNDNNANLSHFGKQRREPKHIEEDRLGLQHQQQEQLYDSLLEVDGTNKLIILIQAGTYVSIFAPNPQCDYMLFSPGRASLLSPLFTAPYNATSINLEEKKLIPHHPNSSQFPPLHSYQPNLQLHVETPHHCAHLLKTVPEHRLALTYVQTFNLRQRNDPKLKDIIWITDCVACESKSEPILVCLASTAFTWEGRYAAKRLSTGLVTVTLSKPTLNPQTNELTLPSPQVKLAQSNLPHNAYKLYPLPRPLLGCLLLTVGSIFYYNLTTIQFSAKLNFFDVQQIPELHVDGVRENTGTVLDRVALSCVYGAVRKRSTTTTPHSSHNQQHNNNISSKSSSNDILDDLDSLFDTNDDSASNSHQKGLNSSSLNTTDSDSLSNTEIYPMRDLYHESYALDPFVQPFSLYPSNALTTSFNHADDKYDISRYLEFLVTAANGNSFVLSTTFSTISQLDSLQLGFLGSLSPVNAFTPLILGAPVQEDFISAREAEMINCTPSGDHKRSGNAKSTHQHVSTLLFAAALWGDSKVYQFQRELSTSASTLHNSKGNALIDCYNLLLEGSGNGYPIFRELDEQHQVLINKLRTAFGQEPFARTIVKRFGEIDQNDEVIVESSRLNDVLGDLDEIDAGNDDSSTATKHRQQNCQGDEFGESTFDLNYLKQLGVVLESEEMKNREIYKQQRLQKKQHQKMLKDLQKARPPIDGEDDVFAQNQDGNDGKNDGKSDDEEDEDEIDDEDYEDDITYDQRKRRLHRPIIPPWLIIERDLFFSLAPLNNIQPVSTSLLSAHTNSTTSVVQGATKQENLQLFGDTVPKSILPFTNERTHNDVISLVATGSYCSDGKVAIYNDCMMPLVVSTQTVQTSRIPSLFSPSRDLQSATNPIPNAQNTPLVLPDDVITGMYSFTIRDIPAYILSLLSLQSPPPTSSQPPLEELLAASNTTVFDIDPVLSLHKTKQILRIQGFQKNGETRLNSASPSKPTTYHAAFTQYQSALLFFDQLTQASSILTPFHSTSIDSTDPSTSTILVLTTSTSTFFYTLPTTLQNSHPSAEKLENDARFTPQQAFWSEFDDQIRSYEHLHQKSLTHQIDEQKNNFKQSHGEYQQEQWPIYTFQHLLSNQQELFTNQQHKYLGCHSQDIARILSSLGATQFTPIPSIPTLLDDDRDDDDLFEDGSPTETSSKPSKQPNTQLTPISSSKTLTCGPILGLFKAWVQVTPTNVLLCCNSSIVLCNISLSKILQKVRSQYISAGHNPAGIRFGLSEANTADTMGEDPESGQKTTKTHNSSSQPALTIINAWIQDPYVILHLSNDVLVRLEFNSSPLSASWYDISVISFSSPVPLPHSIQTSPSSPSTLNQDKISAITTAEVDLFSLCPQLRLLLTSTLYRLETLDHAYNRYERSTLRRDVAQKVQQQKDFLQSVGEVDPFTQLQSGSGLVDELDVMLGRDELDIAFNLEDNGCDPTGLGLDDALSSLQSRRLLDKRTQSGKFCGNIENAACAAQVGISSMLTTLPTMKLLLVATLSYFYIIDLASIQPSALFAVHLDVQRSGTRDGAIPHADGQSLNQNGFLSIPLFTTASPGSSLHTLHSLTPTSLNYPHNPTLLDKNSNPFDSAKFNAQSNDVVESTPIREILFGQFDPTNASQGSRNNNNPSNNHFITLRDQSNHVYIYSITEALLSYLPRKLLNIASYIRNVIPHQYPQFAHIITQPLSPITASAKSGEKSKNPSINSQITPSTDKSQFMTFLDVFLEYTLVLQAVQSTTPLPLAPTTQSTLHITPSQPLLSAQDYLATLNKPPDVFGNTFITCNFDQFGTILTNMLSSLPLSLRLEYTSVDDRLFVDQKNALDYYPNQIKDDLKRYGAILFDLHSKYTQQSLKNAQKRAQQEARDARRAEEQVRSTNNNDGENDANDDSVNNPSQYHNTNDHDNSSDDESGDEFDIPGGKGEGKVEPVLPTHQAFPITTEFTIHDEIKDILYNFAMRGDSGPLEPRHFNTTYEEFVQFEQKLLLFNRLQSYSTLQRLNNHQQCDLFNKLNMEASIERFGEITKFNSDEDQSLSIAMTLLSFSTNYHAKLKMQINDVVNAVLIEKKAREAATVETSLNDSSNVEDQRTSPLPSTQSSKLQHDVIDLDAITPLSMKLIDIELNYFNRSKSYFFTHLHQFNLTTLSTHNTLIPFSHNNHNGLVVMGLTPHFLLFNHNTCSNTITSLPLYFHSPHVQQSDIPQAVLSTNKTINNSMVDFIPTQHPTFSQSPTQLYDPQSLSTFYANPSFISSMVTIQLPHLQTNCLLFSDISNTLITCQLPPKFPSTTPTTGSTTSFNPPHDGFFPTELSLFNWKLNKQSTDAITSNKLIIYNAASKTLHSQQQKQLTENITNVRSKLTRLTQTVALNSQNPLSDAPTTLSSIVSNGNFKGNSASAYILFDPAEVNAAAVTALIGDQDEVSLPPPSQPTPIPSISKPTPPTPMTAVAAKDDLDDLFGGDDDAPAANKRALPQDDLDDLFGDSTPTPTPVTQKSAPAPAVQVKKQKMTSQRAAPTPATVSLAANPIYDLFTESTSQFARIVKKFDLSMPQQDILLHTALFTQTLAQHNPLNTYFLVNLTTNQNNTSTVHLAQIIQSPLPYQNHLSSPSPSAQSSAYVYTNPTPTGVLRIKQLLKTPTHLVVHPTTQTLCIATQTLIEAGSAEEVPAYTMPIMVSSFQLDFFSISTGSWLNGYNILNHVAREFKAFTRHEESLTTLTLLTLYDDKAHQVQKKILKTATKSKFGVWCSNGDPITPQTHPSAYNTTTYLAIATSFRDGPLKPAKSKLTLVDISTRYSRDYYGYSTQYLKLQRILEHVERMPIHGLSVLSFDLQQPKKLSYPVPDDRIAFINNYANPFNHFHTHIVLSCGYKVFVYRIDYDQGKLFGEAFYECSLFITSLYTMKNLIVVNDVLKSVTILMYDVANRNLTLFALDHNATYPLTTSSPFSAARKLSLLVFDYNSHVSNVEYSIEDSISLKHKRLVNTFKYYLGQSVLSSTQLHIGDIANKIQLNNLSKLVDITSKQPLFLTQPATTTVLNKPTKIAHTTVPSLHHALTTPFVVVDDNDDDDDDEEVDDVEEIDAFGDDDDGDGGDQNFQSTKSAHYSANTGQLESNQPKSTTSTTPSIPTNATSSAINLYSEAITSGVLTTSLTTHGFDLSLSLQYHLYHLVRSITARTQNMRPPLQYNNLFNKQFQYVVEQYNTQFNNVVRFDDALQSYLTLFQQTPIRQSLSTGFLISLSVYGTQTLTTASYGSTQQGAFLLFLPITATQQLLLTQLSNFLQKHFPFLAATLPSLYHEARSSANFNTEFQRLVSNHGPTPTANQLQQQQQQAQANQYQSYTKQRHVIDFSLLSMFLSLQQNQKRVLVKSLATTLNTLLDLIKYLTLSTYLHPVA